MSEVLAALLNALQDHPQVCLIAPPGAGKSTWLPLQLLNAMGGTGRIIMLEPRRLAARQVALRLAEQLGEKCGETVGYRIRGESLISVETRLEVVTEGLLIRLMQQRPELNDIALIILDEFHERSLHADLALALLLDIQQSLRPDLKLLLMSATLDNPGLATLLPDSVTLSASGNSFPVIRHYTPLADRQPFHLAVARTVLDILQHNSGSLLLFLPGEKEIRAVQTALAMDCPANTDLFPLHGNLSWESQLQAMIPSPVTRRKVVLATNIAETSLTIEGITLVVDTGLERLVYFDSKSGLTVLHTRFISQSSMTQRAGRAGRLAPGQCWHLLNKEQAERLPRNKDAAMTRSDLSGLMLEVFAWGCHDPQQLQWVTPPPSALVVAAVKHLINLGAITATRQLTALGRRMVEIGTEPRVAALLCQASSKEETITACYLAAIIEQPARHLGHDLRDSLSQALPQWQARQQQLQSRFNSQGGRYQDPHVLPLLLTSFHDRLAKRRGHTSRYLQANGAGATLPEGSALAHFEWLIILSQQQTPERTESVIQLALPVEFLQLTQYCPALITQQRHAEWDEQQARLRVWNRTTLGKIVLSSIPSQQVDPGAFQAAMFDWIRKKGLGVLPWNDEASQLRARIACAKRWLGTENWPEVSEGALLDTLEQWLTPALLTLTGTALSSLTQVNLAQAMLSLLNWQQKQQLEIELPTYYTVPTGNKIRINYHSDKPPILSVRLQELYGETTTPTIARGRVPLLLELLSPALRPLQLTQDLAGFWQGAYLEVKKEMKGRYPKHVWPDEPAKATATTRSKRFNLR